MNPDISQPTNSNEEPIQTPTNEPLSLPESSEFSEWTTPLASVQNPFEKFSKLDGSAFFRGETSFSTSSIFSADSPQNESLKCIIEEEDESTEAKIHKEEASETPSETGPQANISVLYQKWNGLFRKWKQTSRELEELGNEITERLQSAQLD